jgi:hypothetical protein
VSETIEVPYQVEKLVPVRETRYAERVEARWVPVDACTGEPITTRRIVPAPGPVTSQKPTPAEGADAAKSGEQSVVKKEGEQGKGTEADAQQGLDKPGLNPAENPADAGHEDAAKDAAAEMP